MKKYEHLPIFGIGPAYVVSILLLTMIAVILKNNHVFTSGRPPMWRSAWRDWVATPNSTAGSSTIEDRKSVV